MSDPMDWQPKIGQEVYVLDPLGYEGYAEVEEVQLKPHHSVRVKMKSIVDRTDQSKVGQSVWVLTGHVHLVTS